MTGRPGERPGVRPARSARAPALRTPAEQGAPRVPEERRSPHRPRALCARVSDRPQALYSTRRVLVGGRLGGRGHVPAHAVQGHGDGGFGPFEGPGVGHGREDGGPRRPVHGGRPLDDLRSARPLPGVLAQGVTDQGQQSVGHTLERGRRTDDAVVDPGGNSERVGRCRGVGDEQPPAEDVAGRKRGAVGELLRCHPAGSAGRHRCRGDGGGVQVVGDAEVHDVWTIGRQENVRRLQVAVGDPRAVDAGQRVGDGRREGQQVVRAQGPGVPDVLVQGVALDVGGRQPGQRGVGVGVDQRHEVWAGDLAERGGLPAETGPVRGVVGEALVKDLHGEGTPAVGVGRVVDRAHTAGSEVPDRPVGADAFGQVHRHGTLLGAGHGRTADTVRPRITPRIALMSHVPPWCSAPSRTDRDGAARPTSDVGEPAVDRRLLLRAAAAVR